jgi:hypothetical protein
MSSSFKSPEDWYLYYVASPYSHPSIEVRKERYKLAVVVAKTLTRLGYSAFVPIAYDGLWDLDPNYTVDHSWSFWERIDIPILDRCSALILFEIPGWETSKGVTEELKYCEKVGIPVMPLSLFDLNSDAVINRKMSLLKGMIRLSSRSVRPQFSPTVRSNE